MTHVFLNSIKNYLQLTSWCSLQSAASAHQPTSPAAKYSDVLLCTVAGTLQVIYPEQVIHQLVESTLKWLNSPLKDILLCHSSSVQLLRINAHVGLTETCLVLGFTKKVHQFSKLTVKYSPVCLMDSSSLLHRFIPNPRRDWLYFEFSCSSFYNKKYSLKPRGSGNSAENINRERNDCITHRGRARQQREKKFTVHGSHARGLPVPFYRQWIFYNPCCTSFPSLAFCRLSSALQEPLLSKKKKEAGSLDLLLSSPSEWHL